MDIAIMVVMKIDNYYFVGNLKYFDTIYLGCDNFNFDMMIVNFVNFAENYYYSRVFCFRIILVVVIITYYINHTLNLMNSRIVATTLFIGFVIEVARIVTEFIITVIVRATVTTAGGIQIK